VGNISDRRRTTQTIREAAAVNNDVQLSSRRIEAGCSSPTLEPPADEHVLRRAREILEIASTVAREPDLAAGSRHLGLRTADQAALAGERVVEQKIADRDGLFGGTLGGELAAVLTLLSAVRASIREAELARHSEEVASVQRALNRLRSLTTLDTLVQRAPIEINKLGYHRSLFSRVRGSYWLARSSFAQDDPRLAEAMVLVGSTTPGVLTRGLPETEVVRGRKSILVHDARANPRIHPRLQALMNSDTYVAAPLTVRGQVVGLLHADQPRGTETLDRFDRELLGLFAEGLGCVFERTVFQQKLFSLKSQLEEQARSVGDLIDGFLDLEIPTQAASTLPPPTFVHDDPPAELTRREQEVFRHLAAGETNAEIAAKLYISAGTVKCHVRSLFSKLGAANRADAVARYHALTRPR
jgi:DNA-binding CsgD family transcriptional regulator/GAF domain-containing protein